MRWTLFGIISLIGCQHTPTVTETSQPLGGGVIPTSYTVKSALPGDRPVEPRQRPRRVSPARMPYALPTITASQPLVAIGHATDYRWIVGTLQEERGVWKILYGIAGDLDRYGGSLELLETGPMNGFWPGRLVRVEGELIDPAPLEIQPSYRVRSMHVVGR
ncbi:MAG: hypothetical protein EBV06_14775 [Planctomycetia bacterium]|nr:hypothetical protein [Planctomycetia bacterium]